MLFSKQSFLGLLTLGVLAPAIVASPHHDASDKHVLAERATLCDMHHITTMNVSHCDCRGKEYGCGPLSCDDLACGLKQGKKVNSCTGGCQDSEATCEGCGLWFHSVCGCVKSGKCKMTPTVKPNGTPVWMLIEPSSPNDHNLITTTELIPGIIEMSRNNPTEHNKGWIFAQQHFNPATEALAINSYRTRTHEQVHIHVCNRNSSTYHQLSDIKTPPSSGHLVAMPFSNQLFCLGLDAGKQVSIFANSMNDFLNEHPHACWGRIAAGMLRDAHGRMWACATNNTAGALEYFC